MGGVDRKWGESFGSRPERGARYGSEPESVGGEGQYTEEDQKVWT